MGDVILHNKRRKKANTAKILVILLLIIIVAILFVIINISNKDIICGIWKYDDVTSYEFDGKGRGKLLLQTTDYEFKYNIVDNIIYIDFIDSNAKDSAYKFEIVNNNLFFTGTNGTIGYYKFVK